jgi:16S rRNA (cytidine1402-2'-O)-methyltransferase
MGVVKFYIVATPIGNLEDITLRALRVLKEVDLILCEDTRVTRKLLGRYEISTPTISYHTHSKLAKVAKIFKLLEEGKNLALVSDSGTPAISDPGSLLVSQIREYFGDGVDIIPVPGASALTAALSAAGVPASEFLFLGFFPRKKGREKLFKEMAESRRSVIFYESPHRILKTLQSLRVHLSGSKKVVVARELTKIHEEIVSGTIETLVEYLENDQGDIKGEFVVIISDVGQTPPAPSDPTPRTSFSASSSGRG